MSKALIKSTSAVSAMTLVSRILGFLRDMIAAHYFGATGAVDAFLVAFKIPNFMRNLFAEGAFQQSFVPIISEYRQNQTPQQTRRFISHIAGCLGLVLLIIVVLGEIFTPWVVDIFAPGFHDQADRYSLAVSMLRVTFPYIFFISITALMASTLNSFGKFVAPAFTSSILNICMIATAIWLSPHLLVPVKSQSLAILIAGIVQVLFLIPFLWQIKLLVMPEVKWHDPGVKKVLKLMVPSLFGASISQVSILINTIFASFLTVGSVTWLYYSERLAYFPLGVVGVALATVVLPHLSRKHAERSPAEFEKAIDWGLRCNILVGSISSLTMWVMAGPLIVTLFKYGKYTTHDVIMTKQSVLAYAVGLQAFMLTKMLASGFYAKQDIRTPVKIGIIAVVTNIVLNATLIFPLKHAGLALAASISQWVNVGLLLYFLNQNGVYRPNKTWKKFLIQVGIANFIVAFCMKQGVSTLGTWLNWSPGQRVYHLFFWLTAAVIVYILSLLAVGIRWKHILIDAD